MPEIKYETSLPRAILNTISPEQNTHLTGKYESFQFATQWSANDNSAREKDLAYRKLYAMETFVFINGHKDVGIKGLSNTKITLDYQKAVKK